MPGGNGNKCIQISKHKKTCKQRNAVEIQNKPENKLISFSFTLGNDYFFVLIRRSCYYRRRVCMLSFVNCDDWGIKKHILIKLHFLFLVRLFFVCHPVEASLGVWFVLFFTILRSNKNTCIFLWVIIIVHRITKVSLWYARYVSTALCAHERSKSSKPRKVLPFVIWAIVPFGAMVLRREMRCNQFVCKCHRKMQQRPNEICFVY